MHSWVGRHGAGAARRAGEGVRRSQHDQLQAIEGSGARRIGIRLPQLAAGQLVEHGAQVILQHALMLLRADQAGK